MQMLVQEQTTLSDFFAFAETTDARLELLEGEITDMPSPPPTHQQVLRAILRYLETLLTDGEIYFAPMDVELDGRNVFQPDLMWIAPNGACVVGETRLHGAPDLVVEVASRGTKLRDKREKFNIYERAGVREYWLADPEENFLEVWHSESNKFQFRGVFGAGDELEAGDTFTSALLEKQIDVQHLFHITNPQLETKTDDNSEQA